MRPGETDPDRRPAGSVLIIGYGNPLRGDDGIGWQAAARLERRIDPPGAQVITAHQLTPELAERLAQASLVVLIDACAQSSAGRIRCRRIGGRRIGAGSEAASSWNHMLAPSALVRLTHSLFGRAPRAYVVSVGALELGYGEGLSQPVRAALPLLERRVLRLVYAWRMRQMDRAEVVTTHA